MDRLTQYSWLERKIINKCRRDVMSKEKSCLITSSLIGGTEWFITAPDVVIKKDRGGDGKLTWKEKALQDLSNMVNRIPGTFSEEAKYGVTFEKIVYDNANKDKITGSPEFQQVCNEVRGYEFYKKGGKNLQIDDNNCYFYAKYDAIKYQEDLNIRRVHIKDLKTTGSYKKNKYLAGCQHEIYCYVTGAISFEYIIAEWDKYPKIKAVHKEVYIPSPRLEEILTDKVRDCFSTLKDLNLWEAYRTKYCLY